MILVDSNVILDILSEDKVWIEHSAKALVRLASQGLAMNPIIYAECSLAYQTIADYEEALSELPIKRLPIPFAAGFQAAKAFLRYRRSGGTKSTPLPDFYIGAHAELENMSILTRDVVRFRTYFPKVRLISV